MGVCDLQDEKKNIFLRSHPDLTLRYDRLHVIVSFSKYLLTNRRLFIDVFVFTIIFCLSQKNKPQSRKAVIKLMGTHIHTPFILPKKKKKMQRSVESICKYRAIDGSLNCRPVRRRCKINNNKAIQRQRQRPWRSSIPRLPERLVTYHSPRYLFGNDALSDNEST